jgi:hypothetical protein
MQSCSFPDCIFRTCVCDTLWLVFRYYTSPTGRKLRSLVEVDRYAMLTLYCQKIPLNACLHPP